MGVAIIGCGYVGTELGKRLVGEGTVVYGVRRSRDGIEAVEEAGLEPVRADVTDPASLAAVPDVDAVVFAASAGGRDPAAARRTYLEGQCNTIAAFGERPEAPERYLYTSSTGVYGDRGGDWVDEDTPLTPATERQRILARAERIAIQAARAAGMAGTVARLAGLYGPGRYRLESYLEGPVAPGYLNLCHRDDAAGAITRMLETPDARGEVVTVVDDEPVERPALAAWLAEACGEPVPPTRSAGESEAAPRPSRRCSNAKLHSLGYDLAYPTFREGYRAAVAAFRSD